MIAIQNRKKSAVNNQAVVLINNGQYAEAAEVLEKALAADPTNETIKRNLAKAREGLAEDATDGASMAPSNDDEQLRARVLERIERMKAEGWVDDSASKEETLKVAKAMSDMGNIEQAVIILERALFKTPDDLELERRIESLEAAL